VTDRHLAHYWNAFDSGALSDSGRISFGSNIGPWPKPGRRQIPIWVTAHVWRTKVFGQSKSLPVENRQWNG